MRWHYQWIVAHDFLRRIAGPEVVDNILVDRPYVAGAATNASRKEIDLRFYHWQEQPFMPVEFSAAAYRFGHSMIRPDYRINTTIPNDIPIFVPAPHPEPTADLRGFRPLPHDWEIDWSFFFEVGDAAHLQQARLIDAKLAERNDGTSCYRDHDRHGHSGRAALHVHARLKGTSPRDGHVVGRSGATVETFPLELPRHRRRDHQVEIDPILSRYLACPMRGCICGGIRVCGGDGVGKVYGRFLRVWCVRGALSGS